MTFTYTQRVRILYKTILKLHRGLPNELQVIGTNYTRDEFKRHKGCNEKEGEVFMNEWTVGFLNFPLILMNIYQVNLKPKIDQKQYLLHHFLIIFICRY